MKKVLLPLVSACSCLLIIELGMRFYYSSHLDYQLEMSRYANFMKRDPAVPEMSHEHAPNLNAQLMGVEVSTNSFGYRDSEYSKEKQPGIYRILLLGDSLTLGWGAENSCTFARLLETWLNDKLTKDGSKTRVQVINTGIGNYNTSQELASFEAKGQTFKPDMVILNYFINDAEPTPNKKAFFLARYSYLYMWMWGRINTVSRNLITHETFDKYYSDLYRNEAPGWIKTQEALTRIGKMSRQDGFTLVMSLLPELHAVGPNYFFQDVHNKVLTAAASAGIDRIVDTTALFANEEPSSLWVTPDDAHPNCKAHRIIAQGIFDYISKNNIITER